MVTSVSPQYSAQAGWLFPANTFPWRRFAILLVCLKERDLEIVERVRIAAKNLGWECIHLFPCSPSVQIKASTPEEITQIITRKKPDLAINFSLTQLVTPSISTYFFETGTRVRYYEFRQVSIAEVFQFKGILHPAKSIKFLSDFFLASGKRLQSLHWIPTCPGSEFLRAIPKKLFYCGWMMKEDGQRTGPHVKKLLQLLDQEQQLEVYGPPSKWDWLPNSYKGFLPLNGKSIGEAIRKAGIALILNGSFNIKVGKPTSRVFEAASSCVSIISDRHPFIVEEFGDSVLYIDHKATGRTMFKQIQTHLDWICECPAEAQQLARKAHSIFLQKYTLEQQLKNLKDFNAATNRIEGAG